MVNTGKPSRGCEPCKKRHVKCDLTLPQCRKCFDSGRICPGVPDENDLRFVKQRDPFKPRKRKATAPKKESTPTFSDDQTPSPSKDVNCDSAVEMDCTDVVVRSHDGDRRTPEQSDITDLLVQPSPTWESVAVAFFYESMSTESMWMNPVVRSLQQAMRNSTYKRDSSTDNSVAAIALAILAHNPERKHLEADGLKHYQRALHMTHSALSHPEKSKADDTLLSVILMGMYERIASSTNDVNNLHLLQHSMGAVALVQHRGPPTVSKTAFYELFSVVRASLILECAGEGAPIDAADLEKFWFATPMDPEDHNSHLYHTGGIVPSLRSRARQLFRPNAGIPDKNEVCDLLADARVADTKLLYWFQHLPDEWSYYSIPLMPEKVVDVENSPVWPGSQHVYKDLFLAGILNNYRLLRIFTQSVIAQCLSALDSRQTNAEGPPTSFLYSATVQTVRFLVDDIAASVPSNFAMTLGNMKHHASESPQIKAKEGVGAFYLMRPLWVASCVEGIDELQKRWLKGRLRFIAREYGLKQAIALSESKVIFPMSWRTESDPEHSELLYFHP